MPQIPIQYQPNQIMPQELNRVQTQNNLTPDQARIMQNVDILWMEGRMRRGGGIARCQPEGRSVTVTNSFVWTSRACKQGTLSYSNGVLYNTPSDGTVNCSGPLPNWADATGSGSAINEDLGVAGGGQY